nr:hypothetical protein [uncultured Dongia sp.]
MWIIRLIDAAGPNALRAGVVVCAALACLSYSVEARAEGNCPDGFFPIGGGNAGWEGCAPMGPMDDGGGEEEAPQEESYDDSGAGMGSAIGGFVGILSTVKGELDQLASDPGFQEYAKGSWEFAESKLTPGEFCSAIFTKEGVGLALMGPGGGYDGAFLVFFGPNIPRPQALSQIEVTLAQSDSPAPQTVRAFNTAMPGWPDYGAIFFAVPEAEAAVAGLTDTLGLDVSIQGRSVANLDYHSGLAARDRLQHCMAKRS